VLWKSWGWLQQHDQTLGETERLPWQLRWVIKFVEILVQILADAQLLAQALLSSQSALPCLAAQHAALGEANRP